MNTCLVSCAVFTCTSNLCQFAPQESESDVDDVCDHADALDVQLEARAQPLFLMTVSELTALVHGTFAEQDSSGRYLQSFVRVASYVSSATPAFAAASANALAIFPRQLRRALHASFQNWEDCLPEHLPSVLAVRPSSSLPAPIPDLTVILRAAWAKITAGLCAQRDGGLNVKQAAYLLLVALQIHEALRPDVMQCTSSLLLLGGPGCGKTHMLRLSSALRGEYLTDSVLPTAFMHSAARLIDGYTLHSALGLRLDGEYGRVVGSRREELCQLWQNKKTLRVDEISMVSAELFADVEQQCHVFGPIQDAPWGGLQLELSGDLQQLPPVRATSLCLDFQPSSDVAEADIATWQEQHACALHGRRLWTGISNCILLEYSHRCQGPLAKILQEMTCDVALSDESWQCLQARSLTHPSAVLARQQYPAAPFSNDSCPVGVLRHSVRASACFDRVSGFAARAQKQLYICPASDRSDDVAFTPERYKDLASEHNLSKTAHLSNFLYLYVGAPVLLEHKLCAELGIVRGCVCRVVHILLARDEPMSISNPCILAYVPEALVLQVENASWVRHEELAPGQFYLPRVKRPWSVDIRETSEHMPSSKRKIKIQRVQLPVSNTCALTAYALQGQTLDHLILDLEKPPRMSRVSLAYSKF